MTLEWFFLYVVEVGLVIVAIGLIGGLAADFIKLIR